MSRLALVAFLAVTVGLVPGASARPRWETLPLPPKMPAPATKGTVDIDGARIYYGIYGKGDPVILLHGGLGNSDHWSNQVPALVDKFQVIVIDSRGQGRSTRGKSPITYDVMAGDVLAVMDALKLERAAIVGWSDGGEIGLKLAIGHPDRVAKLFVFGANYDASGSKHSTAKGTTFAVYTKRCKADYTRLSRTPGQWDSLVTWLLPIWRNPMGFTKDQLKSIQAPTVVADGDHDELIVLDQIKEMAELIPNAKLEVFTDTSHFAHWQDPAQFNRALLDFLGS
jgi:pimeloyl-ACP methyl ester carboxylesterase